MVKQSTIVRGGVTTAIGSLLIVAVYLTSLSSYLLFHTIIELFTIIVAAGIFVIAWNARAYIHNNYLLFIAIASVCVALLDFFHTLAYQGMGVFSDQTANLATQLWVAARYLQSISWLLAPFFIERKLNLHLEFAIYILITGLVLSSIFYWQNFPAAYVDGVGLTEFKKISEYIVSFFFLCSIGLLLWNRRAFDASVLHFLVISLILTIGSEIAFTFYVSVYGEANLIGHILRLMAVYFLYKAIIETGLVKPYAILLRDLKHSQDQLREQAATLQIRNDDLTRTEEWLREDAVISKTRNEELDAFAHTVAHDLKNPLSVMITTADIINDVSDLTRRELKEFLRQIKTIAFEMNNIIDSLLLFSEVRKAEAPLEPVNMKKAVVTARNRLSYLIKEHHGRVILPRTWPTAIGYGPWVEEVWANYISNALKYGGPSPCVELGASTQNDGMIRFWTHDHGQGIPDEEKARLFIPFTQLGKVRKHGHGLGLSIVFHIVDKLGGQVGVESEVGKGSLFYFTLPAHSTSNKSGK